MLTGTKGYIAATAGHDNIGAGVAGMDQKGVVDMRSTSTLFY